MQPFEQLLQLVRDNCSYGDAVADETMTPKGVRIDAADLTNICETLYRHPSLFFDMLSCITAIDNGPDIGTMEMVYNLYSIPFNHSLALKVVLKRDNPEIDTVSGIWRTANWHEREAFDLMGISFIGHPDLRRILLPADWEGSPLRKDYKHQGYYRGVKVEY
jgi:NADH-quinone oxidoreductase subunit C